MSYISTTSVEKTRDIEGWVIRCKLDDQPWYFKFKIYYPYMMYRQWRELTKEVIQKKPITKLANPLCEMYLTWVQNQIIEKPEMFKSYMESKGIYHVRDEFLKSINQGNIRQIGRGHGRTLIVPIATIGAGKTILGSILARYYNVHHIQNDNLVVKPKGRQSGAFLFNDEIIQGLATHSIVYADRNNHLLDMRNEFLLHVRHRMPDVQIIFIHWPIGTRQNEIFKITRDRVIKRGENHQSLTPGRSGNFESILWKFLKERQDLTDQEYLDYRETPMDESQEDDVHYERACKLDLDLAAPLLKNIRRAVSFIQSHAPMAASWDPLPENQEIQKVVEEIETEPITVIKDMGRAKRTVTYYGVQIMNSNELREHLMEAASLPSHLVVKEDDLHVTMLFLNRNQRGMKAQKPKRGPKASNLRAQDQSSDVIDLSSYDEATENNLMVSVVLSELRFDGETAAFKVESLNPLNPENALPSPIQPDLHVTMALAQGVRPVQAKELLNPSSNCTVIPLDPPLIVEGVVKPFYS
jgi:tRNA splicing ligase